MTSDLNTAFAFEHRHHLYSAALLIFMRRITIPNSSFKQSFHPQSKDDPPYTLILVTSHQSLAPLSQFRHEESIALCLIWPNGEHTLFGCAKPFELEIDRRKFGMIS